MGSQPESHEAVDIYKRIRPGFEETYTRYPKSQNSEVRQAISILFEGLLAYENGAVGPAALAARAAVEAAGYLFLTRMPTSESSVTRLPRDLADNIRNVDFDEIVKALSQKHALNKTLLQAAWRIQHDGNLVAHLASRNDRDTEKVVKRKWQKTIEKKDPRKPILLHPSYRELRKKAIEDPEHIFDIMFEKEDPGLEPIRLYPSREETYRNLEDARRIIFALMRADGRSRLKPNWPSVHETGAREAVKQSARGR